MRTRLACIVFLCASGSVVLGQGAAGGPGLDLRDVAEGPDRPGTRAGR